MIHTCGYLIIEKKDMLSFHSIKNDFRICGGMIQNSDLPKSLPKCYRKIESFDPHFCDSWIPCDIQECIDEYQDFISMHQNQLNKIKEEWKI